MANWYVDLPNDGFEVVEADTIHRDDNTNSLILVRDNETVAVFVTWGYVLKVEYDEELEVYTL